MKMIKDYKNFLNPMGYLLQWFIPCSLLFKNIYLDELFFFTLFQNTPFLDIKPIFSFCVNFMADPG